MQKFSSFLFPKILSIFIAIIVMASGNLQILESSPVNTSIADSTPDSLASVLKKQSKEQAKLSLDPITLEKTMPNQVDAEINITKAPRVGETVDLNYIMKWDGQPSSRNKVWLEFERYDPAIDYPLGKDTTGRDRIIEILSKPNHADGADFTLKMALDEQTKKLDQPDSIVVSGNSEWKGDLLKKGDQVDLDTKVCFPEEGEWIINAMSQDENGSTHIDRSLRLTVNKDSGMLDWQKDYSSGHGYGIPTVERPVGLFVSTNHAPLLEEMMPIDITIQSILDVDQAQVFLEIYRMDGTALNAVPFKDVIVQGDGIWNGSLKKDTPERFSCAVKFQQEGDYMINFMTLSNPKELQNPYMRQPMYGLPIHVNKEKSRFDWPVSHNNYLLDQKIYEERTNNIKSKQSIEPASTSGNESTELTINKNSIDNTLTLDSTLTFSGYVTLNTRDDINSAKYCAVSIIDLTDQWVYAQGYTNGNGYYHLDSNIITDKVRIKVFAWGTDEDNGNEIDVTKLDNSFYSYTTNYDISVPSGGFLGYCHISDTNFDSMAWWVKDDLNTGYDYGLSKNISLGSFLAIWPDDNQNYNYFDLSTKYIHITTSSVNNSIEYSQHVTLHEMGHAVMDYIYGSGYWPSGDGPTNHSPVTQSTQGFAWKEGWADFWVLLIKGTSLTNGWNFEAKHADWPTGDACEGRVTQALWDLVDVVDDGSDQYDIAFSNIWLAFSNHTAGHHPNTFQEFWDDLKTLLPSDDDILSAAFSIWQNTIACSPLLSLTEAVDDTFLTMITGGDITWFGQSPVNYTGGDAAQSGKIPDDGSSMMATTVNGGGIVNFYWKVSSQSGCDHLKFYIDDTEQDSISGTVDVWQSKSYTLTGNGAHELKWEYNKDARDFDGSDAGWVDKINIAPKVTTNPASNITLHSATLDGSVTAMGVAGVANCYFVWGTTPGGPYPNQSTLTQLMSTGNFVFNKDNLTSNTTYYYKAKVEGDGTTYGDEQQFTTPIPTSITHSLPSDVGTTTATLHGYLGSLGDATSVDVSFLYRTGSENYVETSVQTMTEAGPFQANLSDLIPGTLYYFKTKVDAGTLGIDYSDEDHFTPGLPGDISHNGRYDMGDIILIERIILGLDAYSQVADANLDEKITVADILQIEQWMLGIGKSASGSKLLEDIVTVSADGPSKVLSGSDFSVDINTSQITDYGGENFDVTFDPTVLRLDEVTAGSIDGTTIPIDGYSEIEPGHYRVLQHLSGGIGASGSGTLATLHFHVVGTAGQTSDIALSDGCLCNSLAEELTAEWTGSSITVGNLPNVIIFVNGGGSGTAPSVTTNAAGNITYNSATLNGNLDNKGTAGTVYVYLEWGATASYGNTTTAQPVTVTGAFNDSIAWLSPNTTYHYRAVTAGSALSCGGDQSFTTSDTIPSVTTSAASSVTYNSASLNGILNDKGSAGTVNVYFEWGTDTNYGNTTIAQPVTVTGTFSDSIGGLSPNTTYHYRAAGEGNGTGYGADQVFTTLALPGVTINITCN
jgi:hypothetical protein